MDFLKVKPILDAGGIISRMGKDWVIMKQVPCDVAMEFVPKMTSLSPEAKNFFAERAASNPELTHLRYKDQCIKVYPDNTIVNYNFSVEDLNAEDWFIVRSTPVITSTGGEFVSNAIDNAKSLGVVSTSEKTLNNTTANQAKTQVSDLEVWGDGDTFKLICKASSKKEGWMKSTKAMEIPNVGCVVQVTTQQKNSDGSYAVAEALAFVPGAFIKREIDANGKVVGRKLAGIGIGS